MKPLYATLKKEDKVLHAEHEEAGTDAEEGHEDKARDIDREIHDMHAMMSEHDKLIREMHQKMFEGKTEEADEDKKEAESEEKDIEHEEEPESKKEDK